MQARSSSDDVVWKSAENQKLSGVYNQSRNWEENKHVRMCFLPLHHSWSICTSVCCVDDDDESTFSEHRTELRWRSRLYIRAQKWNRDEFQTTESKWIHLMINFFFVFFCCNFFFIFWRFYVKSEPTAVGTQRMMTWEEFRNEAIEFSLLSKKCEGHSWSYISTLEDQSTFGPSGQSVLMSDRKEKLWIPEKR